MKNYKQVLKLLPLVFVQGFYFFCYFLYLNVILIFIYCYRKPGYYFSNAYSLIFLITISALTIFSIDCRLPQSRLQTTYTLLLTSVSFKWIINRSLPTVSYLTSLDRYAIACIVFISLLAGWHSIVGVCWSTTTARYILAR